MKIKMSRWQQIWFTFKINRIGRKQEKLKASVPWFENKIRSQFTMEIFAKRLAEIFKEVATK